jgi:hypothetical protein
MQQYIEGKLPGILSLFGLGALQRLDCCANPSTGSLMSASRCLAVRLTELTLRLPET